MAEVSSHPRRHLRIAILGGGAGARELLIRLLDVGQGLFRASISVFEPRSTVGRGLAWTDERAPVLANMRVDTLGPSYAEYDLVRTLLRDLRHPEANHEYPTRNAVGAALDERWRRKVESLPQDWLIQHVHSEAVGLEWDGESATVFTRDGAYRPYDIVVLALGNLSAKASPELAHSDRLVDGWDAPAIESIPPDADVLIKGAGLTAVDATLRLFHAGHRKDCSIVWTSRSGTLPYIRPRQLKLDPQFLSCEVLAPIVCSHVSDSHLTLPELWKLFTLELNAQAVREAGNFAPGTDLSGFKRVLRRFGDPAQGRAFLDAAIKEAEEPCLWFSVAKLFDEFLIPVLWNALPASERLTFLRDWRREFDRYFEPLPLDNGLRVRQWLSDDSIQLLCSHADDRIDIETGRFLFDSEATDPLQERTPAELKARHGSGFDFLIDATGIASDIRKVSSELVANLLRTGLLTPNDLPSEEANGLAQEESANAGSRKNTSLGARVDWPTGAVLAKDGRPQGWLYTLAGSLTIGAHWYTNSFMAASASAQRVAADLARKFAPN